MEKPRTRFDVLNNALKSGEKAKSEARIAVLEGALKKGKGAPTSHEATRGKGKNDVAESEIRKNLEATEADWEKMEEDLDWMAREEETKSILGVEGLEKIERLRQEAAGEIEAVEKKEPAPEPAKKVIMEEQEPHPASPLKGEEPKGDYYEEFRTPGESREKGADESAKKKEKSAVEKKTPEKLSLTELDSKVNALWGAMEEILQDAADFKPSKEEAKAMKKWIKKGQGVEDWPLDDIVTADNYKKRLEKYDIADLIDPSKIEPHNDAYAVVSKQYKKYRDELESRIRKAKIRQLEKLEKEEAPSKKEEAAGENVVEIEEKKSEEIKTRRAIAEKAKSALKKSRKNIEKPAEELEIEKEEKKPGEDEVKYYKVGDMVRANNIRGKSKFGWRVDGYDEHGWVKISREGFLRKPEKQLIPEKVLRALNKE